MQDENLAGEDHRELLKTLHTNFGSRSKDVIVNLHRITSTERQKIEELINVGLYPYQSKKSVHAVVFSTSKKATSRKY